MKLPSANEAMLRINEVGLRPMKLRYAQMKNAPFGAFFYGKQHYFRYFARNSALMRRLSKGVPAKFASCSTT